MLHHNKDLLSLLKDFHIIYLYSNHHIEIINNCDDVMNSKSKSIRIITLNDLLNVIDIITVKNELNFHYDNGLPKDVDYNYLVSIVLFSKDNKIITYYQFTNETLPFYNKESPSNFSMFTSKSEMLRIEEYIKDKKAKKRRTHHYSVDNNNNNNNSTNCIEHNNHNHNNNSKYDLNKEPEPYSEHFYCQLCDVRFEKYKEHIESQIHQHKVKENEPSYNKIMLTLKRIYNKYKINNNNNNNSNSSNNCNNTINSDIKVKQTTIINTSLSSSSPAPQCSTPPTHQVNNNNNNNIPITKQQVPINTSLSNNIQSNLLSTGDNTYGLSIFAKGKIQKRKCNDYLKSNNQRLESNQSERYKYNRYNRLLHNAPEVIRKIEKLNEKLKKRETINHHNTKNNNNN